MTARAGIGLPAGTGLRAALVAGAMLLLALALPAAAAAHALLQSSSPSWNARLSTAPDQIVLHYSEEVAPDLGRVSVLAPGGRNIAEAPRYHAGDVTIPIRPVSGRGSFTVRWRMVAADDGHVTEGAFSYGVRAAAQAPAAAPGGAIPVAPELLSWLQFLGVVLAGGVPSFRALVCIPAARRGGVPAGSDAGAALWCAGIGAVLAVHAGLFGFLVGAYPIVGGGISSLISTEIIPIRDGTHLGQAFTVTTFAWLVILALVVAAWGLPRRREPLLASAGVLSLAAAFGITWSSHPDGHGTLAVLADVVHLVTAAFWVGGVIALALLAWSLRGVSRPERAQLARACLIRFSQLAVPLVALLGAAGIYLAVEELPSLAALGDSGWGLVLVAKTAVALCVLGVAAYHHRWVVPRLRAGISVAAVRRTLAAEAGLLLCVIGLAAVLAQLAPPG